MDTQQITDKTVSGLMLIWQKIANIIPDLIVATLFIIIGYFCAKLLSKLASKSLAKLGFDVFMEKIGINQWTEKLGFHNPASKIFANLFATFLFFLFLLAALDTLGFTKLSGIIDTVTLYLPKLFAALAILILGFFFGQLTFNGVRVAAKNAGLDYGRSVAEVCRGIVIIITLSLAITQLDVDVSLLNTIISVIIASIGLASAISLGIGTKALSQEIISGVYLRELFQPGDNIAFDDVEGTLTVIGNVATKVLTTDEKIVTVPNTYLLNNKVTKTVVTADS
jgi:small-conductance mechanosensitive channel